MISSLSTVLQYQNRPDWARQHGHPFAASPHSFASLVKPMDSILGSHRSVYSYVVKSISAGAVIPLSVHALKVPAVEYIKRICSVYMNRCDSSPLSSEAGAKQVSGSLKFSAKLKIDQNSKVETLANVCLQQGPARLLDHKEQRQGLPA